MKRRDFLLSTSSLLLAPVLSHSQGTATPPSTADDIIFADFESGTYEGWTLEGNCWLPEPASTQTFLDPRTKESVVTGIGGKRFLVSFHRSPAETGKATSKEFTITKPFINFLIGGGYYPNQACLNLVVDGKVVRTETGNNSNELRPRSWDVFLLLGKKAHFEIVDSTQSPPYGYIMVDDIRFTAYEPEHLLREPLKTLRYFANHARDQRIFHPETVFGVPPDRLLELDARVCRRLIETDFDYHQSLYTVQSLAKKIQLEVAKIASSEGIQSGSVLGQRMLAGGISAWVRTHIPYNEALPTDRVPLDTQALYWTSATLLEQPQIFAVCAGYSRLTQDLADALKMKCYLVLGVLRNPKNSIPPKFTHSWNVFVFGDSNTSSFYCPCDNTIARIPLATARNLKGQIHHLDCFPLSPEEWGYFLWRQRATLMDRQEPMIPECALDPWTEDEWRAIDMRSPESLIAAVEKWLPDATIRIIP